MPKIIIRYGSNNEQPTKQKSTASSGKLVTYSSNQQAIEAQRQAEEAQRQAVRYRAPSSARMQQIAAENENARYRQAANSGNLYRGSTYNPGEMQQAMADLIMQQGGAGDYNGVQTSFATPAQLEQARANAARLKYGISNRNRPYTLAFARGVNPNDPLSQSTTLSTMRYQALYNAYQQWLRTRPEGSMLASNAPDWMVGVGDLRNVSKGGTNIGNSTPVNSNNNWSYGGGYGGWGGGSGGYTPSAKLTYWNGNLVNWRI